MRQVQNHWGTWPHFYASLSDCLSALEVTDAMQYRLDVSEGFGRWHDMTGALRDARGTLYLIGNGASASMSSHFAVDLHKNARIRTHVFTDPALITAMGNDIGFERVFADPLLRMALPQDILITISSSGQSPNILAAIDAARHIGLRIVTLSGMNAQNASRQKGDLNFYIPADTYGMVETAHAAILHYWTDSMVASVQ